MEDDLTTRAARHAALGDPVRLAVVDELVVSDRAPVELCRRLGLGSNLLAHHLDVLESAGLVGRSRSGGDGRRRYVHLHRGAFDDLLHGHGTGRIPLEGRVLFVCTRNSARSQLAAALWGPLTGGRAASAGTEPADRVHRGAVAAARRAGLDLSAARPARLDDAPAADLIVTVCDRAHEELGDRDGWLHWSVPDPVPARTARSFDATVAELRARIGALVGTGRAA
ncbi:MAG: helix-turn-helix domain-containing protein [Microthrixaceae bacterium]